MAAPPPPYAAAPAPRQGLAIASLVLGILSLPTLGCLGVGALLGIVLGIVALTRTSRAPHEYGGRGFAIAGIVASALSLLVAIPLAGIVAAVAIPSLLRARVSANEAAAIGDVRSVISAQAGYQSLSCGVYGPLRCLHAVSAPGCVESYPTAGPTFIDAPLASLGVKGGYSRAFHPGPDVTVPPGNGCAGGSGYSAFAYVAEPETRGKTGVRSFCGDDTGMVCAVNDGRMPAPVDGRCAPECAPLR